VYSSKSKAITLHHADYSRMGYEPDSDLFPLCIARGWWRRLLGFEGCHYNVHALARMGKYKDLRTATEAYVKGQQRKRRRRERSR
jgi:hypothetical protein